MHMHSVIMILMFIDFYYQIACRTDIGYIISFFLDDWCLMKVAEKIFKFFHLLLKFQLIFSDYAWHQNMMLHVYSILDIIIHPARDFDNKFSTSVRKNHFGTKKITCNFALCMKSFLRIYRLYSEVNDLGWPIFSVEDH